jgi:serine/threonine protein phosphatase 1
MGEGRTKHEGRTMIIGDIHGRYTKLMQALGQAGFDESNDRLLGLGDYIDRGRETARVLDYLVERKARYPNRDIYLRGNHEEVIAMVLEGKVLSLEGWIDTFQGFSAVRSYGIAPERFARAGDTYLFDGIPLRTSEACIAALRKILPESHIDFISQSQYSSWLDEWFLCHAGLRLGARIEQHHDFELVWGDHQWYEASREELERSPFQPRVIIGHWHNRRPPVSAGYKRIVVAAETEVSVMIYEDMVVVDNLGDVVKIKPEWYE